MSRFNKETNDKIKWAKWSWNPVTGCLYGCPYCYARDIGINLYKEGFTPTFRSEKLSAPQETRLPAGAEQDQGLRSVFVCSMGELFGEWVSQEWIDAVLREVRKAPHWTYIFITKNPERLAEIDWPANAWVGATVDGQARVERTEEAFREIKASVKFVSCEPLLERIVFSSLDLFDWLIVGARSKNSRLPAFQPAGEWISALIGQAREAGAKVYVKPNVSSPLFGQIKEYPELRQPAFSQGVLL